jgi:exonuclease III
MVHLPGNLMDNMSHHFNILSWNVRGLNSLARQENLKQVVAIFKPDLVCIQETKMEIINSRTIRTTLGPGFEDNFHFLPADGTRGGILLATKGAYLQFQNHVSTEHTISATILDSRSNAMWTITRVYGPQGELDKKMFIREIKHLNQAALPKWLLIGDFNLICQESDKNNSRINRRLMLQFRRALNHL